MTFLRDMGNTDINIREITVEELARMRAAGKEFQLIDIREPYEAELCSLGGKLIPMGEVTERLAEIRRDIPVIMHCRSGNRGAALVQALSSRYGFTNLANLRGGITAWQQSVEPSLNCD